MVGKRKTGMKKAGMKKTQQKKSPKKAARKRKPRPSPMGDEDFITGLIHTPPPGGDAPGAAAVEKRSLGERIREAREMRELTLEDLSSRSGIPVARLQRVESNRAIPPLGELIRLGKALEMEMGYFISAGVDRSMCVVRAGSRLKVARRSQKVSEQYGYIYESLAPEKAHRLMEPFLVTLAPTEFAKPSVHDGQEFLFVLEGKIRVKVDEEAEILGPGDAIYYDSSHPHLVKCYGKGPAKILAVIHTGDK
jgi:quercetin dioxygenase-like cupin family protein/ribosome-binding protein aMBF1 (putative translation factor)